MQLIIPKKTPGNQRALDEEVLEINLPFPRVLMAFCNEINTPKGSNLSLQRARQIIQEHEGENLFYLKEVSNQDNMSRPLGMLVEGSWDGGRFHCTNISIDPVVYAKIKENGTQGSALRSEDSALHVGRSLAKKGLCFKSLSNYITSHSSFIFSLRNDSLNSRIYEKLEQLLPVIGLSAIFGIIAWIGLSFTAMLVVSGCIVLGGIVVTWARNRFKKHSYKEYAKKNEEELSALKSSEQNAFLYGFQAGKSYLKYFRSYISWDALLHIRAYYAGNVAGEASDQKLMNKVLKG